MSKATFVYKQAPFDGGVQDIEADVWYSEDGGSAPRPIAFYFHPGSFTIGSRLMLQPQHRQRLLDLGFVIVSPDYRLIPTINAYDGAVTDTRDAYKWAHTELPGLLKEKGVVVDASKIVSLGGSCGGTLALLTGSLEPRPRAIADFYGFKYWADSFYHTPSTGVKLPPFDKAFTDKVYADIPPPTVGPGLMSSKGTPDFENYRVAWMLAENQKGTLTKSLLPDGQWEKIEPAVLFDKPNFPPTVFVHGSDDVVVPIKFSKQAYEALQAKGVKTKLITLEGAAHGFDMRAKPGDKEYEFLLEALDFLKENL